MANEVIPMSEQMDCMQCGGEVEYNGRSYDCENCNTRWTPHNLEVSKQVQERKREVIEERRKVAERKREWHSLSLLGKLKVMLKLETIEVDEDE